MPLYDYKCSECGHTHEEFYRITSEPVQVCPKCNRQTYQRQVSLPHTDLKEFRTPIEMFSIAMEDPDEIREFARKCPDVDVCTDPDHPDYGVPIARTRKAKLQALKAAGFIETNSERVR